MELERQTTPVKQPVSASEKKTPLQLSLQGRSGKALANYKLKMSVTGVPVALRCR
jgi:hypothetical protein